MIIIECFDHSQTSEADPGLFSAGRGPILIRHAAEILASGLKQRGKQTKYGNTPALSSSRTVIF
jgi:hypothetical protein